ncbi:MAG: hypothetical protein OEN02_07325 [Gammaproteobacteria bacterium]|nr:hypothetical protein [Gammaproteobacteria bacterium]
MYKKLKNGINARLLSGQMLGESDMNKTNAVITTGITLFFATQQVSASEVIVPEIDGSGAIIAIGLIAGLVALVREKFFRK